MRGVAPSILRQLARQRGGMRFNSSNPTSNAQKKAQEALASAQNLSKKYINQETLASVQKTAGSALNKGIQMLGPVGQRAGSLLGAYKEPVLYNFAVARELVKQVYRAEGLSPPTNVQVIREAYETLWSRAKSPAYWREQLRTGEILRLGVLGLEAYGIFKIGEIIGRRSLVGYNVH